MSESTTTIRAFKYRLYPSKAQEERLFQVLEVCLNWYNMCLAERKWAYHLEGRSVTKNQQEKAGIAYRKTFPQAQIVFSQTLCSV
jgi:putative transposase